MSPFLGCYFENLMKTPGQKDEIAFLIKVP